MNKKLSFKKFFKENGDKGVVNVASNYAKSADSVTLYVLSEKYNISRGAVRTCIRYAIENCLISYSVAYKAKEKAHRNQKRHSKDSESIPTTSDRYYERLFEARDQKVVMSLKSKIKVILEESDNYRNSHPNSPEELKIKEKQEKELRKLDVLISKFLKTN